MNVFCSRCYLSTDFLECFCDRFGHLTQISTRTVNRLLCIVDIFYFRKVRVSCTFLVSHMCIYSSSDENSPDNLFNCEYRHLSLHRWLRTHHHPTQRTLRMLIMVSGNFVFENSTPLYRKFAFFIHFLSPLAFVGSHILNREIMLYT